MLEKIVKRTSGVCFLISIFAVLAHAQVCQPAPVGLISWWPADGNALDRVLPLVYEELRDGVSWQQGRMFRYEKMVEERRLGRDQMEAPGGGHHRPGRRLGHRHRPGRGVPLRQRRRAARCQRRSSQSWIRTIAAVMRTRTTVAAAAYP